MIIFHFADQLLISKFRTLIGCMSSSKTQKILDSSNEIRITVTGRKTGRKRSTPIWFVRDGKTIFLLPARGTKSQWYRNVVKSKRIGISFGKVSLDLSATPISDSRRVASIVEMFQKKHGERWYPTGKFDVAVEISLP